MGVAYLNGLGTEPDILEVCNLTACFSRRGFGFENLTACFRQRNGT